MNATSGKNPIFPSADGHSRSSAKSAIHFPFVQIMTTRSLRIAMLGAIFSLPGLLVAEEPVNPAILPGVPEILRDALMTKAAESGHWAYTETIQEEASAGKPQGETIVRFDPSKPYAEQYTALKINGNEPTEKQRDGYRRRGEGRGRRLARATSPDNANPAPPANGGVQKFFVDYAHAAVFTEDATSVTYQVPIKNDGKEKIPVDKFQSLIRVNREHRVLEQVEVKLKEALRMKVIAKLNAMDYRMDFTTIDPQFPPQLTSSSGTSAGGVLFMSVNVKTTTKRTDFQRVKPFDERAGVKTVPVTLNWFSE